MAHPAALPQTYCDLAAAYEQPDNTFVNVIGSVVDLQAPTTAKTGQFMCTFKILDPRLRGALRGEDGLTVRFFNATLENLPVIRNLGDVVLLRSLKMTTFAGARIALANWTTEYLIFPSSSIPDVNFSIAFKDKQRLAFSSSSSGFVENRLNLAEQSYIIQLKQDMTRAVADRVRAQEIRKTRSVDDVSTAAEHPAKRLKTNDASLSTKFKTIAQLRDRTFADVCVLVVKKSQEDYGCDLYVTDYTSNELMRYYAPPEEDMVLQQDGDQYGHLNSRPKKAFPGPYGHQVLKVNLKPPHAQFAKTSVHEGDCIVLRNIKVRITSWSGNAFLEGDLWPDDRTPEQINIRPVKNTVQPVVKSLLERKAKYDATRQRVEELQGKIQETKSDISKRAKKKEKKEKKAQKQSETMRREGMTLGMRSNEESKTSADERREEQVRGKKGKPKGRDGSKHTEDDLLARSADSGSNKSFSRNNPHVRCSYDEVRLKHIKDILDANNSCHTNTRPNGKGTYILPFINACYRSKVRVVDYFPRDLANFAVPVEPAITADEVNDSMQWLNSNSTPTHEWSFSLVLEAASARQTRHDSQLEVQLHHEQAVFLLGKDMEDPEDLRLNPHLLAKLREKLFVLWGNLEEKSEEEELDNMPFECCIMEYGIEIDETDPEKAKRPEGWKRMYAMFGTTIL